jgi:HEAT repeat protein
VPDLRTLLEILISGDEARAEATVPLLAARGDEALPALIDLLSSPEPDQRWWAARALAALDGELVIRSLEDALGDSDPAVRQCAALGLRQHPTPRIVPSLCAALSDPDRLTARLAGDALIAAGAAATTDLVGMIAEAGPAARIEAVRALAGIQDQRSIPTLYALLDEPSTLIQHWAEEGLERMGVGMVYFKP